MSHLLPDYYEALASAIERLPRNDRAARGALYDRARRLLMEEAQKADPPWQLMEIVREQRALEEAILKAEANYASQVAAPSRPKAPAPTRPRPRQPQPAPARDEYDYEEEAHYEPEPPRHAPDYEEAQEPEPRRARTQLPQRVPRRRNGGRTARPAEPRASYPLWGWAIVGGLTLLVLALLILLLRPDDAPVVPPPAPARIESKSPPQTEESRARAEERSQRQREAIARGNDASRAQDYAGAIAAYSEAINLGPVPAAVRRAHRPDEGERSARPAPAR